MMLHITFSFMKLILFLVISAIFWFYQMDIILGTFLSDSHDPSGFMQCSILLGLIMEKDSGSTMMEN